LWNGKINLSLTKQAGNLLGCGVPGGWPAVAGTAPAAARGSGLNADALAHAAARYACEQGWNESPAANSGLCHTPTIEASDDNARCHIDARCMGSYTPYRQQGKRTSVTVLLGQVSSVGVELRRLTDDCSFVRRRGADPMHRSRRLRRGSTGLSRTDADGAGQAGDPPLIQ